MTKAPAVAALEAAKLENKFFEIINEWIENSEVDDNQKRDLLGILLMRVISCVIATAGSPMEIGHLIAEFEAQLSTAVNLVTDKELPNPIKNIGE